MILSGGFCHADWEGYTWKRMSGKDFTKQEKWKIT